MPKADQHFYQYEKNKLFLSSLLGSDSKQNDWIVTVAFYTALHLVDKTIVTNSESYQPKNHEIRKRLVDSISSLKSIRREYYYLYMESRKSRYHCNPVKENVVSSVITQLEKIEEELIVSAK
ncbi:TPA: hypothetical protein ACIQN7_005780 [Bacillus cereus]